ncbi:hypothetical protein H257_10719 [Aphanomyces astaci]|uniref:Uncharacterized protein n=1 Tax=Aphanomyces astaci TaxID=112090 RepID=W4G6N5_APHAT|nr:hypothetical protein H257_10719 [Aphanomyces astaci]ETV74573.1 hypothetical protein H257_10719 [Aphanomyces astaci]|eukprot:XP_009835660.1 hypothetical protein H257_10719 [Aphanomyces astaci]
MSAPSDNEDEYVEPVYLELEGREMYLVKLPKELGSSWKTNADSEIVLGTLKMNKRDAAGNRKGQLSVNPSTLSEEIPLDYRTVLAPSNLSMKVFSQDGSGRMAIEGKITESCTLMPQPGALYKKQLGDRYLKSMQKGTVVPLESTPKQVKGSITLKIPKPRESDDEEEEDLKFNKEKDSKKIKMDRDALKNEIFKQFEKRDYWPLKELNLHCRQPEAYLKEILREICIYHKKGPNKSCYELQPHLKGQHNS